MWGRWAMTVVADIRDCEQCGSSFARRREHARFCCAGCRAAWNREHMGDPAVEQSALLWSVTAMGETSERLCRVRAWDRARALAVIGEAVWWVTIVDATLVRHHPRAYDAAMAGQPLAGREVVEETLAGLRFVRNQIGGQADLAELIGAGPRAGEEYVTGWVWKPVPPPALEWLSPRGQAWEMTRHQAYEAQLAGHAIGETFGRAVGFLKLAAANVPAVADASVHAVCESTRPARKPRSSGAASQPSGTVASAPDRPGGQKAGSG